MELVDRGNYGVPKNLLSKARYSNTDHVVTVDRCTGSCGGHTVIIGPAAVTRWSWSSCAIRCHLMRRQWRFQTHGETHGSEPQHLSPTTHRSQEAWPLLFRLLSGQGITSLLRDRNPHVVKTASKACWQESCKWLHEGQSECLIPFGVLCAKCRNGTKVTNKCSRMAPGHHLLHPHSAVCFSKSALHIYSSWSHLSGRCSQFWEWEWN